MDGKRGEDRKHSHNILRGTGGRVRQAGRERGGGLKSSREREGDGERSSLGNLFWSSQSADTQGAGKPITV